MSRTGAQVPWSLAAPKLVAPFAILIAALVMIVEGFAGRWHEAWIAVIGLTIPTVAVAVMAARAAEQRGRDFLLAMASGFGAQTLVGMLLGMWVGGFRYDLIIGVLIGAGLTCGMIGFLGIPVLIAANTLGRRRDLEAGDALIGFCGALLAAFQGLKMAIAGDHVTLFLPGFALGLFGIAMYLARAVARRRWCERASRGEIEGWRVRTRTSNEELALLPPVCGGADSVTGVVERVEIGGMLYRSGPVGLPVAAMRVTP